MMVLVKSSFSRRMSVRVEFGAVIRPSKRKKTFLYEEFATSTESEILKTATFTHEPQLCRARDVGEIIDLNENNMEANQK